MCFPPRSGTPSLAKTAVASRPAPLRRTRRAYACAGLRAPAGSDHSGLVGEDHELNPVWSAELGEQARHVRLDGGLADSESSGNLRVRESLGHRDEDLLLSRGHTQPGCP